MSLFSLAYGVGNYAVVFRFCGLAYVVALGLFHVLAPRLEPAVDRLRS